MRRVAIISIVLCVVFSILFCGCAKGTYKNKKADDEISKQIYEILGEDVYYVSKKESQGIPVYEYLLKKEDKEIVQEFVRTVDLVLSKTSEKFIVFLSSQTPSGREYTISLMNYSDSSLDEADLDGAKSIIIQYPSHSQCEIFKDLEIYTVLEDVQFLEIDEELQKIAEEQGIDWYEVWPTLEEMWIRSGSEKIKVERNNE